MRTEEKKIVFHGLFRTGSHGACGECHCGIFHFDVSNEWDDDHQNNVLPEAEKNALEHPEMYQFNDHSIEFFDFNGRLYVHGCRCGMDVFIFELLTEDKQNVLSFYKGIQDKLSVSDVE